MRNLAFALFVLLTLCLHADSKRIIITGGPGAGKTTILLGMELCGFDIVREAASDVIKISLANAVLAPWNQEDFQEKVLVLQQMREKKSLESESALVFYDRSPIDTLTYQKLRYPDADASYLHRAITELKESGFYHDTVFIVENFGECLNNEIRHESRDEALELERLIEAEYIANGFRVIKIPPIPPTARVNLILNYLKES